MNVGTGTGEEESEQAGGAGRARLLERALAGRRAARERDLEVLQLRGHVLGGRVGLDRFVDRRDRAVLGDVERPAVREPALIQHAVRISRCLGRIGQEREVRVLLIGEAFVVVERSTLIMKYLASYALIMSPCSASDLHSIVQPRV